jgi:hypothetical protein
LAVLSFFSWRACSCAKSSIPVSAAYRSLSFPSCSLTHLSARSFAVSPASVVNRQFPGRSPGRRDDSVLSAVCSCAQFPNNELTQ